MKQQNDFNVFMKNVTKLLLKTEYNTQFLPHGHDKHIAQDPNDPILFTQWEVGGASGGNCWGDMPKQYTLEAPDQEFDSLDYILEHIVPDMKFLVYKKLIKTFVIKSSYIDHEYYGNFINYKTLKINLRDLFKFLCDNGIEV